MNKIIAMMMFAGCFSRMFGAQEESKEMGDSGIFMHGAVMVQPNSALKDSWLNDKDKFPENSFVKQYEPIFFSKTDTDRFKSWDDLKNISQSQKELLYGCTTKIVFNETSANSPILLFAVHGTFSDPGAFGVDDKEWSTKFLYRFAKILAHVNDCPVELLSYEWSGGLSLKARKDGAIGFATVIRRIYAEKNNNVKELWVISHSHGGNVVAGAARMLANKVADVQIKINEEFVIEKNKVYGPRANQEIKFMPGTDAVTDNGAPIKIDRGILLAPPLIDDYGIPADSEALNFGKLYTIYSRGDLTAAAGSLETYWYAGRKLGPRFEKEPNVFFVGLHENGDFLNHISIKAPGMAHALGIMHSIETSFEPFRDFNAEVTVLYDEDKIYQTPDYPAVIIRHTTFSKPEEAAENKEKIKHAEDISVQNDAWFFNTYGFRMTWGGYLQQAKGLMSMMYEVHTGLQGEKPKMVDLDEEIRRLETSIKNRHWYDSISSLFNDTEQNQLDAYRAEKERRENYQANMKKYAESLKKQEEEKIAASSQQTLEKLSVQQQLAIKQQKLADLEEEKAVLNVETKKHEGTKDQKVILEESFKKLQAKQVAIESEIKNLEQQAQLTSKPEEEVVVVEESEELVANLLRDALQLLKLKLLQLASKLA